MFWTDLSSRTSSTKSHQKLRAQHLPASEIMLRCLTAPTFHDQAGWPAEIQQHIHMHQDHARLCIEPQPDPCSATVWAHWQMHLYRHAHADPQPQSLANFKRASDPKHEQPKTPAQKSARRSLSELRRELDNLDTAKKRQRLDDQSVSGSASTSCTAPHAAADMYRSLPTNLSWDRTNTQTGGLHNWALDELDAMHDEEIRAAAARAPTTRRGRGRLTGNHAVAIFNARLTNPESSLALKLAGEFQVTPKAIRDIWARKTWIAQTMPFWELSMLDMVAQQQALSVTSPIFAASAARVGASLGVVEG